MADWLVEAFLKGGPYALSVPLAVVVGTLWKETQRLRDLIAARDEKHAADTAARQERHAAATAELHQKHAEALAALHAAHNAAVAETTEARLDEMGKTTAAALALTNAVTVLDRVTDRLMERSAPADLAAPSRPRLPSHPAKGGRPLLPRGERP